MKTAPSKKAKGRGRGTERNIKNEPFADKRPARAHRGDTPEARLQASRQPKSHPGKASAPRNAMRPHKAKGRRV